MSATGAPPAPLDGRSAAVAPHAPPSLVTSRNNFDIASGTGVFRVPRPYVQACCKGSLGLYYDGGRVVFKALACGSWSCPTCRRVLAARTLDALREGLEARAGSHLALLTPTVDPSQFGAFVVGKALWDDGRETNLWSEPTPEQFARVVAAMSRELKALMDRVNLKAKRLGLGTFGYFRVVELHRNGWPHYHLVLEHPSISVDQIQSQVESWQLGRVDVRPVSIDDAVGELAPYLVCNERKGAGSKAYQFAATALPKHFRLYSSSRGFLLRSEAEIEAPVRAVTLRGHFSGYHRWVQSFSESFSYAVDARLVLPRPAEVGQDHKPPSSSVAAGEGAVLLFVQLLEQSILKAPPPWFRPLVELVSAPVNP